MARKGILVSDPSVERTSRGQWVSEYLGLRKREESDRKFTIDAMKNILIHVLGLRVPVLNADGTPKAAEELTAEDKEGFVPFIFLGGNHHLIKKYFEKFPEPTEPSNPEDDARFDELSRKMAEDDGDMVPIVDPHAGKDIKRFLIDKQNQALGVKILDDPAPATDEVKISETPPKAKIRHSVSFEEP